MEFLRLLLLFAHLLAVGTLLGGLLVQARSATKTVGPVVLWAGRLTLLIGILQVGLLESLDGYSVDQAKIGVKLLVSLAVVGLLEVHARRRRFTDGIWGLVTAAVVSNVAVAVFWSSAHAVR